MHSKKYRPALRRRKLARCDAARPGRNHRRTTAARACDKASGILQRIGPAGIFPMASTGFKTKAQHEQSQGPRMSISLNLLIGSDVVVPAQSPVIVALRIDGSFGRRAADLDEQTGGMLGRACASPR